MNPRRIDPRLISISVRLYQGLLLLYPREFRAAYSREMARVFSDMACEPGENLAALWAHALRDTVTSVIYERCEAMKKERLALLVVAIAVGLAIAWVDSRPTWNDSGITAGALLFSAALIGAVSPRSPWQWALAVGLWIPLRGILGKGDFSMLLVLLFTFAGAYLGAFLRKTFAPLHPSPGDGA